MAVYVDFLCACGAHACSGGIAAVCCVGRGEHVQLLIHTFYSRMMQTSPGKQGFTFKVPRSPHRALTQLPFQFMYVR